MALYFLGDALRMQDDIPAARAAYTESLQLYRSMGNLLYLAYPLGNLGRIALLEGDTATAQRNFAECVAYSRRNGNQISLVDWLTRLGSVAVYADTPPPARTALQEAYALANELAYQLIIPHIQSWLALTEGVAGNHQQAIQYLRQSLEGYADSVDAVAQPPLRDLQYLSRLDFLDALVAAAYLHVALTQLERAVVVISCIEKLARKQGCRLDQPLQAMVDRLRSTCQAALDDSTYLRLWQQGQTSSVDTLLTLAASFELLR
jgi:tetratricopeptide (TPR) repeat protein